MTEYTHKEENQKKEDDGKSREKQDESECCVRVDACGCYVDPCCCAPTYVYSTCCC